MNHFSCYISPLHTHFLDSNCISKCTLNTLNEWRSVSRCCAIKKSYFFCLSRLLRRAFSPCKSPELSKQGTSQPASRDAGEPHSSGPPRALLLTVKCLLLAQPNSRGLREGSQPCLCPGKEPTPPCCWPHQGQREQGRHTCWKLLTGNCTEGMERERDNLELRRKLEPLISSSWWKKLQAKSHFLFVVAGVTHKHMGGPPSPQMCSENKPGDCGHMLLFVSHRSCISVWE